MTLQSPCCGAAVRAFYGGDYHDDTYQRSDWYVCVKCGKDCDPVESEPGESARKALEEER